MQGKSFCNRFHESSFKSMIALHQTQCNIVWSCLGAGVPFWLGAAEGSFMNDYTSSFVYDLVSPL